MRCSPVNKNLSPARRARERTLVCLTLMQYTPGVRRFMAPAPIMICLHLCECLIKNLYSQRRRACRWQTRRYLLPRQPGGGLATLVGVGSALYGLYQALGGGEGEGLFGLDIFGGDSQSVGGVELGGPGLAEPSADMVEKEWHVNYDWGTLQYYLVRLASGRKKILLYNTKTKKWKAWAWRTPRLAVIGKNMPSHKMITRLRRNLKKHSADARTILRMTSPTSLASYSKKRRR